MSCFHYAIGLAMTAILSTAGLPIFEDETVAEREARLFAESPIVNAGPMEAAPCGQCYCCPGQSCFLFYELRGSPVKLGSGCGEGNCSQLEACSEDEDFDEEALAEVWNTAVSGADIQWAIERFPNHVVFNRSRRALQITAACLGGLIAHVPLTTAQQTAILVDYQYRVTSKVSDIDASA